MHADASQPRDTQCVWFFGIVGHEACPILLRTRVHTFFLSDPTKAASLMPCGDHNTYWAVAITGEGGDIKVRSDALEVLQPCQWRASDTTHLDESNRVSLVIDGDGWQRSMLALLR